MEVYADCKRLEFARCRDLLPTLASDFPKKRVIKDSDAMATFHRCWDHCMVCGKNDRMTWRLEVHHMIFGACGRSDESTVLLMLCGPTGDHKSCHARAHGGDLSLGKLLWIKWLRDRETVDWMRLAILYGRFLPDLEPDQELEELYRRNRSGRR